MVTIIDRTGERKEFKFDQRVYAFGTTKAGQPKTEMVLDETIAGWLLRSNNPEHFVHTTEGEFVRRYGVVDAPEDWVTEIGVEVLETSPLTRDTTRLEGWDAEAADPLRAKATVLNLKTPAAPKKTGDYVTTQAESLVRS